MGCYSSLKRPWKVLLSEATSQLFDLSQREGNIHLAKPGHRLHAECKQPNESECCVGDIQTYFVRLRATATVSGSFPCAMLFLMSSYLLAFVSFVLWILFWSLCLFCSKCSIFLIMHFNHCCLFGVVDPSFSGPPFLFFFSL